MKFNTLICLVIASISAFAASASTDMSEEAIKARIQPVGQVRISGAEPVADASASGPKSGADVYQTSCATCHGTGIMNAPKPGDSAGWTPRVAQGMDVLLEHALNGFNAMPARGTCGGCSDDEIKAAIEHMIEGI